MPLKWFVKFESGEVGPIAARQLKKFAEDGIVLKETPVRTDKTEAWIAASRVKGLFVTAHSQHDSGNRTRPEDSNKTVSSNRTEAVVDSRSVSTQVTEDRESGKPTPVARRLLAIGLDVLVCSAVLWTVYGIVCVIAIGVISLDGSIGTRRAMASLLGFVEGVLSLGFLLILVFRDTRSGQSIGKAITNIRVIRSKDKTAPLPFPWGGTVVMADDNMSPTDRSVLSLRFCALLLDLLFAAAFGGLSFGVVYILFRFSSGDDLPVIDISWTRQLTTALCIGVGALANVGYILLRDTNGGSVAKRLLGLEVRTDAGNLANSNHSVVRNLFLFIPLFPLLEGVIALLRSDGRRTGDLFSGTQVLRVLSKD